MWDKVLAQGFYPSAFGYDHNASGGTRCRLGVILCARLLSKRACTTLIGIES